MTKRGFGFALIAFGVGSVCVGMYGGIKFGAFTSTLFDGFSAEFGGLPAPFFWILCGVAITATGIGLLLREPYDRRVSFAGAIVVLATFVFLLFSSPSHWLDFIGQTLIVCRVFFYPKSSPSGRVQGAL